MKKTIAFGIISVICLMSVLSPSAISVSDEAISWYCVRNSEHRQPIADARLRIVENYNGYYVDKAHGDGNEEKVVYLTFDAGYENGNVAKILDVLKDEKVHGAFFILANLISHDPELVIRMSEEGHTVANHTTHHKDMTQLDNISDFQAELESLESLYRETTGKEMSKYYRPPEGKFDERSLDLASKLGYKTIFWSFAYADWDNGNQPSADSARAKILDNIHNGAVILLHPTSETNALILRDIIRTLRADGYSFGTLDELTGQNSN